MSSLTPFLFSDLQPQFLGLSDPAKNEPARHRVLTQSRYPSYMRISMAFLFSLGLLADPSWAVAFSLHGPRLDLHIHIVTNQALTTRCRNFKVIESDRPGGLHPMFEATRVPLAGVAGSTREPADIVSGAERGGLSRRGFLKTAGTLSVAEAAGLVAPAMGMTPEVALSQIPESALLAAAQVIRSFYDGSHELRKLSSGKLLSYSPRSPVFYQPYVLAYKIGLPQLAKSVATLDRETQALGPVGTKLLEAVRLIQGPFFTEVIESVNSPSQNAVMTELLGSVRNSPEGFADRLLIQYAAQRFKAEGIAFDAASEYVHAVEAVKQGRTIEDYLHARFDELAVPRLAEEWEWQVRTLKRYGAETEWTPSQFSEVLKPSARHWIDNPGSLLEDSTLRSATEIEAQLRINARWPSVLEAAKEQWKQQGLKESYLDYFGADELESLWRDDPRGFMKYATPRLMRDALRRRISRTHGENREKVSALLKELYELPNEALQMSTMDDVMATMRARVFPVPQLLAQNPVAPMPMKDLIEGVFLFSKYSAVQVSLLIDSEGSLQRIIIRTLKDRALHGIPAIVTDALRDIAWPPYAQPSRLYRTVFPKASYPSDIQEVLQNVLTSAWTVLGGPKSIALSASPVRRAA